MRHLLRTTAILLATGGFALTAQAQDTSEPQLTAGSPSYCDMPWVQVDGNSDGFVSQEEATGAIDTQFGAIDADGNGEITKTEYVDCKTRTGGQAAAESSRDEQNFAEADANKDSGIDRNEFRDQARKRAKLQLLLNRMAEDEKVSADEAAVEAEIKHAMEHFPDAKPDLVRVHIETVLRNVQPLFAELNAGGFAIGHNGNLTNAMTLRRELVREKTRLPEQTFIFKHALTQEAVYQSLLTSRRQGLRARRVGRRRRTSAGPPGTTLHRCPPRSSTSSWAWAC